MYAFFLVIMSMILCAPVFSEEMSDCCCETIDSRIQIGGNYTYAHIKPDGNPSTQGSLGGAQALYEYRPPNDLYAGAVFAYRQGFTHNAGAGVSRSVLEFDVQERFGYTFASCDDLLRFSLFTGVGYRHFGENVTTSGGSVYFDYNEIYIPVGFLFEGQLCPRYALGLNFQWMPQVYPTMRIIPLDGARWIIKNRLDNFLVEVPLTITLSDDCRFFMIIAPFFELWHDGRTTAQSSFGLPIGIPRNTYYFGGVNINFAYSF